MIIANYNMDIGDFWEWSDTGLLSRFPSRRRASDSGVNYVTYGLTH